MRIKNVLSLLFVLALLTGCESQVKSLEAPLTISVLFNNEGSHPFKSDWRILEEYKSRKDVTLDVLLGEDSAYDKSIASTFVSGNIPDVVLKCYPESIEGYAKSGVLLPFSDYENLMPNFMAYIQEHNLQGELDKLRQSDGKVYILPGYQREIQVQQWIYRSDIFVKNNLKMPDTYEEMFDSLVQLKALYPDSTPITACWGGAHLLAMMGANYGIPAGWSGTSFYNTVTDKWQYAPATENYKELYSFLNRCYAAGILDMELFTQDTDAFTNKLQNGTAFITATWITSGFNNWNTKLEENGVAAGRWEALPVMKSTNGTRALPAVDPFRKGLIIPLRVASEKYFQQLMAFIDWAVYSKEGMELTTWGVEGLTFQNTANGKVFMPDIKTPKNPNGTVEIENSGFNQLFNLNENPEFEDYKKPADIIAFLDRSEKAKETLPLNPVLKLSSDDIEVIRAINERLQSYVDDASYKFITGDYDIDRDWNEYISEMENLGYRTIESTWNNAWTKQNSN